MNGYTVDVDALQAVEDQMRQFHTLASDKLREVEGIAVRVGGAWEGYGANSYEQKHREWVAWLGEMNEALVDLADWIKTADEAYRTTMATNLRMARG
jgi:WXG100 family type VII secretion target